MKLHELIGIYNLHDSMVENLIFSENEAIIRIEIDLCNWKQSSYRDNEPEMRKISILFTGVKKCSVDPEPMSFQSDEILEVEMITSNFEGSESMKFVLRGDENVKIVIITADEAILINE